MTSSVLFQRVLIIDQGSPSHAWARGKLLTGEQVELFVFPSSDESINPKNLVGQVINVCRVRESVKEGPTRFACNAMSLSFQEFELPEPDHQLELPEPELVDGDGSFKKRKLLIEYTLMRDQAGWRAVEKFGFKGRNARTKAYGCIVDMAIQHGLI
jgi:hypothetical protein